MALPSSKKDRRKKVAAKAAPTPAPTPEADAKPADANPTRMQRRAAAKKAKDVTVGKRKAKRGTATTAVAEGGEEPSASTKSLLKGLAPKHAGHTANLTLHNASAKTRRRLMVQEMAQAKSVAAHPAFVADPLGALGQHLAATSQHLKPQTPDIGRKPVK